MHRMPTRPHPPLWLRLRRSSSSRRPARRAAAEGLGVLALAALLLASTSGCRRTVEVEGLRSADPQVRARAAAELAADESVPAEVVVQTLTEALESELETPTGGAPPEGSWFSARELAAWSYASALGQRGEEVVPALRRASKGSRGPLRDWLLVARGHAGDRSAAPELLALLGSPSPALRAESATLLGQLGYRPAVGALRDLLEDPFQAPADRPGSVPAYPVRQVAASALGQLGVEVRPGREPGTYRIPPTSPRSPSHPEGGEGGASSRVSADPGSP